MSESVDKEGRPILGAELLPLFAGPGKALARGSDPETSREAARALRGDAAGRMETIVLEALHSLGGEGTAYQCVVRVQETRPGIDSNTITPRFARLEVKGLIQRTNRRGPGRGSRTQIIWEVVQG